MRRGTGTWRGGMGVALAILVAYLALLALMWWGQERLIFLPAPLPAEHRFRVPADVHEAWVDVPGARLNALHLRLHEPRGVVFFLHGNAGNLDGWFDGADFYRQLGFDLYMLDYRGYGKSTGRIRSEAQLQSDVAAAWQSIAGRYEGRTVVFLGRSLGSALAASLAASLPPSQRPHLLILVSPYRSAEALAREHYPFVPTSLLRYPLRTDAALGALVGTAPADEVAGARSTRVLLVHGDRDDVIGSHHSDALRALVPSAAHRIIEGAGHNDLQGFAAYRQAIRDAIEALPGGRP